MIKKWFFDNHSHTKDKESSWVQLSETEGGESLEVYVEGRKTLSLTASLDQWGTWIWIASSPICIAQEWGTKSFVQALMAALTQFSEICDLEEDPEAQKPRYEEST